MAAYESLLTQLVCIPAPDKAKMCFSVNNMPCWKKDSLESFAQSFDSTVEVSLSLLMNCCHILCSWHYLYFDFIVKRDNLKFKIYLVKWLSRTLEYLDISL